MTLRREGALSVQERGERDARFLARVIPEAGRVVGLVYPDGTAARSATAAAGIASAVGLRREHTLLIATESGEGTLDDAIGGRTGPGLASALTGEARLTDVAFRGQRRPYVYLPAGASAPPPRELIVEPRLRGFVERARSRGGTLLLHLPEAALPRAAELLDGYVSLGVLRSEPTPGVEEYGRVLFPGDEAEPTAPETPERPPETPERPPETPERPPETAGPPAMSETPASLRPSRPAADRKRAGGEPAPRRPAGEPGRDRAGARSAAPPWMSATATSAARGERTAGPTRAPVDPPERTANAERAEGRWSRHRARARLPVVRIAVGTLVVLALAAGWWVLGRESIAGAFGPSAEPDGPAPTTFEPGAGAGAETAAGAAAPTTSAEADAPGSAERAERLADAVAAAPELPYSVLIASFARGSDAEARVSELGEAEGTLFFVAPTPVRGRVYHRVFAGALAEAAAARRLMETLVEGGRKDAVSAWDVRPARLAFRLGVFSSRSEAGAAERRAVAAGIPVYVVPAAAGPDTAFQLYTGAYESEPAARAMAALLEETEWSAELATRRGIGR